MATPPINPVALSWGPETPVTLDWTREDGSSDSGSINGLDFTDDDNSQYQPAL